MYLSLAPRIILFAALVILIAVVPWWVAVILIAIPTLIIRSYPEVVALGIILDSLYGTRDLGFISHFIFTLSAMVFLGVVEYIRRLIFRVQ